MLKMPAATVLAKGEDTGVTMSITTTPDQMLYPIMCSEWSNAGANEPSAIAAKFWPSYQPTGAMQVMAQGASGNVVGKLDVYMPLTPGNWMIGGPWGTVQIGSMIVPDGTWLGAGTYDVVQ